MKTKKKTNKKKQTKNKQKNKQTKKQTNKKIARTHENITFCNTISSGFAKPQEHTDGEMTP